MRMAVLAAAVAALGWSAPPAVRALEIDSDAQKLTLGGLVQPLWIWSSLDTGDPSNQFLLRRARLTMKVKITDQVGGLIEPEFGLDDPGLADCYFQYEPSEQLEFRFGQTKRRFDLFELEHDAEILVLERDGRLNLDDPIPTYGLLVEQLQLGDRDIGLFVLAELASGRVQLEGQVTNGAGANRLATLSEKAYGGRVSFAPLDRQPLDLHFAVGVHPYAASPTDVNYAPGFEVSVEWGRSKRGSHLQAGVVTGENWNPLIWGSASNAPTFVAFQGIYAYRFRKANPGLFEAIEPLFRLSWADPDTDTADDGGVLLTPGVNLWVVPRVRMAANIDIFVPDANDIASTPVDESETGVGLKAAAWLAW